MAATEEYMSVMRRFTLPSEYESAGFFLSIYAADGWELVTVLSGQFVKTSDQYEIFYLKRKLMPLLAEETP